MNSIIQNINDRIKKKEELDTLVCNENLLTKFKQHKIIILSILFAFVFVLFIISIMSKPLSEEELAKINAERVNEKQVKDEIRIYKISYDTITDYPDINVVYDKLVLYELKKCKYSKYKDIKELKFSTLGELKMYESELISKRVELYNLAYAHAIDTIIKSLETFNPDSTSSIGLSSQQKQSNALIKFTYHTNDKDYIIYKYLKNIETLDDELRDIIKAKPWIGIGLAQFGGGVALLGYLLATQ